MNLESDTPPPAFTLQDSASAVAPAASEPLPAPPSFPFHRTRTRQGKIARLPATVRNEVNEQLRDGHPYHKIISWLLEQGYPDFNEMNLSRWKDGGYQEWLVAQERLEQREFKHELAEQHARTSDPTYHDAGVYLAQLQFFEALNRLDGAQLSEMVKDNRKEFIQLLKTFTHFNRYCLQREKFRHELQRQDQAEQSRHKPAHKAITDPTLEIICDQLGLK